MKYEKPEVTVLTPAVDAIQGLKNSDPNIDGTFDVPAYADWE